MLKKKPSPRHQARCCTVQALYQWQMTGEDYAAIIKQFFENAAMKKVDDAYFQLLLREIINTVDSLDEKIEPHVGRKLTEIDRIELAVLRIAAYELIHCPEIPYRVVLNEALELVKTFGSVEGYKFINGALDPLAKELRQIEINADKENRINP